VIQVLLISEQPHFWPRTAITPSGLFESLTHFNEVQKAVISNLAYPLSMSNDEIGVTA
jgi:hypothetical protein